MKLLITGATGFIGLQLSKKLLGKNHDLYAILRKSSSRQRLDRRVKVFVFDKNLDELIFLMRKEKFDGIIHLASLFLASHQSADVTGLIESNVLFSTLVLEAAVKSEVPWFINTGTFTQHYHNKKYSPVNLYSATKQAFEDIAQYYQEASSLNFVTIKLFDTFGPGDMRPKVFSLWSKIAETGELLDMSPGEQVLDMNYVENVADGYIKMSELLSSSKGKEFRGKTFTLSSGERHTLRKLSKIFEQARGKKLHIHWGKRPYRDREVMVPWQKGKNVPGWKPKIPLKKAIQLTLGRKK